jgi:sugar/nucleoside kinase (ribokinase family)
LYSLQTSEVLKTSEVSHHLLKALRFGTVTAALVVGGQRGVLSAPTLAEVEQLLHA